MEDAEAAVTAEAEGSLFELTIAVGSSILEDSVVVVVKKAGPQRAVNVVVVSDQSQAVVTRGPRAAAVQQVTTPPSGTVPVLLRMTLMHDLTTHRPPSGQVN